MWRDQGATFLHLVDLDGALAGRSVNEAVIRSIVEAVDIPVEIGGGIRTAEAVQNMLDLGVARVIIGTKAVERPEFMGELVAAFGPERIVAGVDARDGLVAIQGWEELSSVTARELCPVSYTHLGNLAYWFSANERDERMMWVWGPGIAGD